MYVAAKLRSDLTFPAAFELFAASGAAILDVGCGVGLLAAYLRERGCEQPITGVDRDPRKIALAREMAANGTYAAVEFRECDISSNLPPISGHVALFDTLHYLPQSEQTALLRRIAAQLPRDGVVAIRDAVDDASTRFRLTHLGEKFAQLLSWNVATPLDFPTAESIRSAFPAPHFVEAHRPLWGRTPFNNYLFTFKRE